MKVWTYTGFIGHWPVGTAAVVVADTAVQAADLLNYELEQIGLQRSAEAEKFTRLMTTKPLAVILQDGDY